MKRQTDPELILSDEWHLQHASVNGDKIRANFALRLKTSFREHDIEHQS